MINDSWLKKWFPIDRLSIKFHLWWLCNLSFAMQHLSPEVLTQVSIPGISLGWTILLGAFQSYVAHVVYRLWSVSASEFDRYVANNAVNDKWCYLLCHVPWTCHQSHPELGLIQKTIPWKGTKPQCGNFRIFLPHRFYVKSVLKIGGGQKLPGLQIQRLWI